MCTWEKWTRQFITHQFILIIVMKMNGSQTSDLLRFIKDVDKSEVISTHLIESPILVPISPEELSGSVKTIMLMLFDETGRIFNASVCGDNCAKWILKIAESKDLTINLRHIMEFGDDEFEMKILNTGEIVHNMPEFVSVAGLYV